MFIIHLDASFMMLRSGTVIGDTIVAVVSPCAAVCMHDVAANRGPANFDQSSNSEGHARCVVRAGRAELLLRLRPANSAVHQHAGHVQPSCCASSSGPCWA
jgi:hypothetical protein